MSILRLADVRREIGDFVILDSVSATLARGERVGLVGANGAGKTTLLRMISGREDPDGGTVHVAAGTRIGLLGQEANLDPTFINAAAVRPAVRAGAVEVEQLERRLAELESHGAEAVQTAEYAHLQERFEVLDFWLGRVPHPPSLAVTFSGLGPRSHEWIQELGSMGNVVRGAAAQQLGLTAVISRRPVVHGLDSHR